MSENYINISINEIQMLPPSSTESKYRVKPIAMNGKLSVSFRELPGKTAREEQIFHLRQDGKVALDARHLDFECFLWRR